MVQRVLLTVVLLALCVPLALGKQGVVKTKDGRSIEGDITEGGDGVTIRLRGGTITLPRSDVASVMYAENVQEAYQARLKELPKGAGAPAHMELARWLYDNKAYDLSLKEVEAALAIDPNNAQAVMLRQAVERAIVWERNKNNPKPAPTTPAASLLINPKDRHLLNADQVNIIRQKELRDNEVVIVRLENDVARRFAESRGIVPAVFARTPPFGQAQAILHEGTAEMAKDVKIVVDPPALRAFKMRIQPTLLKGCATLNCHGGKNSGDFVLYSPANNDIVTYTNFYFLTRYAMKDGSGARVPLIDRTNPDKSAILQLGLPRDVAELDHPDVQGWTPAFRGPQDPLFRDVLAWIGQGLIAVEPKYGFEFKLPWQKPEDQVVDQQPAPAEPQAQPVAPQPGPAAPPSKKPDDTGANDARQKADEARERIKPINPGSIPIPPLPF